jgi:hypothetical protein
MTLLEDRRVDKGDRGEPGCQRRKCGQMSTYVYEAPSQYHRGEYNRDIKYRRTNLKQIK